MGSSLAGVFEVFHRVLATRLREAATAEPTALPALVAAICDSCARSEHTYLHAQQLLAALGRGKDGAHQHEPFTHACWRGARTGLCSVRSAASTCRIDKHAVGWQPR